MLCISGIFLIASAKAPKYVANVVPEKMTVQEKKKRFYTLIVPIVQRVHIELQMRYKLIEKDIKNNTNSKRVALFKRAFKATSDDELLAALKPQPNSVTLAQAAIESSWATSRFFVEANNIFGMWSVNPNEPRIPAREKRGGKKIIWLKRFGTLEESVRAYYRLLAVGSMFKKFRAVRLKTEDPFEIVKSLKNYSEMGEKYSLQLEKIIRYNKLTKYDR